MLNPGDRFGDYRVARLLGQGGMGAVYLLENNEGGQIAAKILDKASSSDHESRKRFLREAQLALGVKHPNLIETYDVGEDPDTGLCYILMEYVPGGSLADRIEQQGPLPIRDAIRIVYQIASVLELAQQKGIVHRDIKPANIMFAADGTAKLADLGIARRGIAGTETTTVTQTGMMLGTPAYMAPEQMLDAHNVDIRADIYSLGIVFYEMLAGERPNADDTIVQLMAKAVKGEPLPDVRTLRPEVSASVAELVSLMCAMNADERIATPAEVTTAISQIAHGHEVTIKRKRPKVAVASSQPRLFVGRARLFAAGVFAVFALVGIGVFSYMSSTRHVPPNTEPVAAVPVAQTAVVERVVEKPVVKPVARPSVVMPVVPKSVAAPISDEPVSLSAEYLLGTRAIVGCDLSPRGEDSFYCWLKDGACGEIFGRDAVAVPFHFHLDDLSLSTVNVMVLDGTSYGFSYTTEEMAALRRYVEGGGVLLTIIHGSSAAASAQIRNQMTGLLNSMGLDAFVLGRGEGRTGVRLVDGALGDGTIDAFANIYFTVSDQWRVHATFANDESKPVASSQRIGKGMVVAVAWNLFFTSYPYGYRGKVRTDFPWSRLLNGRLRPLPASAAENKGHVFAQAPFTARSKRYAFGSVVVEPEELRKIAHLSDEIDRSLEKRFGVGFLETVCASNVLVGWVTNGKTLPWRQRMAEMGVVEFDAFNSKPMSGGVQNWVVKNYVSDLIWSGRPDCMSPECLDVEGFMAATILDDLKPECKTYRAGHAIDIGELESSAKAIDPRFSLYDFEGRSRAATKTELKPPKLWNYVRGRGYAVLSALWRRHPSMFIEYRRLLLKRRTDGRPDYRGIVKLDVRTVAQMLSEVTGEDVAAILDTPSLILDDGTGQKEKSE